MVKTPLTLWNNSHHNLEKHFVSRELWANKCYSPQHWFSSAYSPSKLSSQVHWRSVDRAKLHHLWLCISMWLSSTPQSAMKIAALLRQTNILQKLRHLCAILNSPTMITSKHKYGNSDGNLLVCIKYMVVARHRCKFHTMTKICSPYQCAAATLFTACLSQVHNVTVLQVTSH